MNIPDITTYNFNYKIRQVKYIKNQIAQSRNRIILNKIRSFMFICVKSVSLNTKISHINLPNQINFVFNQEIISAIQDEIKKSCEYEYNMLKLRYELRKITKTKNIFLKLIFILV